MANAHLTERQQKWFASVRAGLQRDTGKTMEEWVEIARSCPETAHRARLKWFKETHGLMQNRASQVISEAFEADMGWSDPQTLIDNLWTDPQSRLIFDAISRRADGLPDVIQTSRKGYSAWSRRVQFAALRPAKGGRAILGLATPPDADLRLTPRGRESWSERLVSRLTLSCADEVDATVEALLAKAWESA